MASSSGTGTDQRILDAAQYIIQSRGYSELTLEDVANAVGIRKSTIIHYFDGKAALATAVVARYRRQVGAVLGRLLESPQGNARDALAFYCQPYIEYGDAGEKICLCGALAGEFCALPEPMKAEVRGFFCDHQRWLEEILGHGVACGEIGFSGDVRTFAKFFLEAMQGAVLISRVTGDRQLVREAVASLKSTLGLHGVAATSKA